MSLWNIHAVLHVNCIHKAHNKREMYSVVKFIKFTPFYPHRYIAILRIYITETNVNLLEQMYAGNFLAGCYEIERERERELNYLLKS